jgi:ankyrin repeat protein
MTLDDIAKDGSHGELANFLRAHPVNEPGELANALSAFVFREEIASALLLLEHGATPNCQPCDHMPPLFLAVEQRNPGLVRLLCSHGADVNYRYDVDWTPLHLAVDVEADTAWQRREAPSTEMVELLLALGADPGAKDVAGRTPLNIAEDYGFSRAIDLLTTTGITSKVERRP